MAQAITRIFLSFQDVLHLTDQELATQAYPWRAYPWRDLGVDIQPEKGTIKTACRHNLNLY